MSERTIVYVTSHKPEHPGLYGTIEPVLVGDRDDPVIDPVGCLNVPEEYADMVRELIYDAGEINGAMVAIEWSGDIGASPPVERLVSDVGFDPTCKVLFMPGSVKLPPPVVAQITGSNYGDGVGVLFTPRTDKFAKNVLDVLYDECTHLTPALAKFVRKNVEGLRRLWHPETDEKALMADLRLQVSKWLAGARPECTSSVLEAMIVGSNEDELSLLTVGVDASKKINPVVATFKHGIGIEVGKVGGIIRRLPGSGDYSLPALQYLEPELVEASTDGVSVMPLENISRVLDCCRRFSDGEHTLIVDVFASKVYNETYNGFTTMLGSITIHLNNAFKMKIKTAVVSRYGFSSALKLKYDEWVGFSKA